MLNEYKIGSIYTKWDFFSYIDTLKIKYVSDITCKEVQRINYVCYEFLWISEFEKLWQKRSTLSEFM